MTTEDAITALAALAHEHRLAVFRMLVKAGPQGVPAGEIAEALDMPPSSLSFHLAQLSRAGLASQRRESRSLIYSADYTRMNGLLDYLVEDCCQGRPEVCEPMAQTVSRAACCTPSPRKKART